MDKASKEQQEGPIEQPEVYEQRYCAFVDILGFQGLIDQLRHGKLGVRDLRSLLKQVHDPRQIGAYIQRGSDFRVQSISDAVAMSSTSERSAERQRCTRV
jgi:hypothetical protein